MLALTQQVCRHYCALHTIVESHGGKGTCAGSPIRRTVHTRTSGFRALRSTTFVVAPREGRMTGAPPPPQVTAAMEAGGAYNRSSTVQAAGLAPAVPWLTEAANLVPLGPPDAPLIVADYGSSQGRNSLAPLSAAIGVLRERAGADRPISVVHTDLPDNDFSALFQTVAADPASYVRGDPNIFSYAIGRSFYESLFPSGSVTLGWSSWAVQWMSRVPTAVPDHIHHSRSAVASVRAAYARQGAEDWQTFLALRARELRPGGRLVILLMALGADGDFGFGPVMDHLQATLTELVADGFVTPAEHARMVIPTIGRSRSDLLAPFAASGRFAGLEVVELDIFRGADPIWDAYEASRDVDALAVSWAAFTRAFAWPTFAAALDRASAVGRAAALGDRLEADLVKRFVTAPVRMPITLGRVHLVKVG